MRKLRGFWLCWLVSVSSLCAANPVILTTIQPLAWMAQAIAPAGANVQVLLPPTMSPHEYQLRPADVAKVQHSALLLWVGPAMEPWLVQWAKQLPAEKNLALLPNVLHEDESPHDEAVHSTERDPHLWLDPLALRAQAPALAEKLIAIFPQQADEIHQRQQQFEKTMTALDAELVARFSPVAVQGFVVYHDGYQRLVQRYHLNQRAAVWHHESIATGARDRAKLLQLLNSGSVRCLFYEPEHGADVVQSWLGNAAKNVRMVEIDPLGASAKNYVNFMRDLSKKMTTCLASN